MAAKAGPGPEASPQIQRYRRRTASPSWCPTCSTQEEALRGIEARGQGPHRRRDGCLSSTVTAGLPNAGLNVARRPRARGSIRPCREPRLRGCLLSGLAARTAPAGPPRPSWTPALKPPQPVRQLRQRLLRQSVWLFQRRRLKASSCHFAQPRLDRPSYCPSRDCSLAHPGCLLQGGPYIRRPPTAPMLRSALDGGEQCGETILIALMTALAGPGCGSQDGDGRGATTPSAPGGCSSRRQERLPLPQPSTTGWADGRSRALTPWPLPFPGPRGAARRHPGHDKVEVKLHVSWESDKPSRSPRSASCRRTPSSIRAAKHRKP